MAWCDYCNGLGFVECECGGDICVCENYGVMPCPECDGDCGDGEDCED